MYPCFHTACLDADSSFPGRTQPTRKTKLFQMLASSPVSCMNLGKIFSLSGSYFVSPLNADIHMHFTGLSQE